jgi:hypothetical protein
MDEQRPFKFVCADVDNDGKDEIIYTSRKGYTLGVIGVDKIPANGDGSEKWTLKYKYSGTIGYDLVVMNKVIYQFTTDGTIIATKFDGTNWNSYKSASNLIPSGSWKSACVVDLDKDGKKEIVAGSAKAGASKVFLIQVDKDTVYTINEIADLNLGTTGVLRGGDCGDIDNDGKIDFVYGSKAASVNGTISRLSYKGGSITDKNNYEVSVLDKGLASGGEWDIIKIANVDNDSYPEVIYGNHTDGRTPLTILGLKIQAPETIAWEKTSAKKTLPAYFGSNTERGMALGKVNGEYQLFVVSRNGGPKIIVHDAITGDSLYVINKPAVDVGYFPLNVAGVSEDGDLYAANMTLDASSAAFTVYRWNTTDTAKQVISFKAPAAGWRMGDAFNVYGKTSDNSLTIWCGVTSQGKLVKFTTSDYGKTFKENVITLDGTSFGSVPNIALLKDGSFYFKSYSKPIIHYSSDGKVIDTIKVSNTSATNIKYFEMNNKKYLASYLPAAGQTGISENVQLIDITSSSSPVLAAATPSLGKVSNLNGTGGVEVMKYNKDNKETVVFYVMGSNNGIAAYTYNDNMMLAVIDTLFYGNSQNLLKNPFGAGFIAGTNSHHDLGKAEKFDMSKDDEIVALKYYFAYKKVVGTPDTLNFVIRGNNSGKPGAILKTISLTTDKIDTTGQGNVFFLDSPMKVALAGTVFVGVEWSQTANDTIALFTDKNGEGDKKSRAWELYTDGTWGYFDQPTSSSWNLDADLWIGVYYKKAPQVTGVNDGNMKIPMEYLLAQNYPNPFNPMTTIKFSLRVSGKVSLKVYNILGMEVASLVDGDMQAGQQMVSFNASRFASGVYIYSLKVEGRDGSKFNSAKKMLLLK